MWELWVTFEFAIVWWVPTFATKVTRSYSSWSTYSSNYKSPPPPPRGGGGDGTPPAGTSLYVKGFICNSSASGYNNVSLASSFKSQIVSSYRSFNYAKRCPDSGGFDFWQRQLIAKAGSSTDTAALNAAWPSIYSEMSAAAYRNGEDKPAYKVTMDSVCTSEARKVYGASVKAEYVNGSGDQCKII